MAYTINLTDGSIFATIADGTINTSSSMTLVGKNYAGYGQFLDDNYIHLLENSSNTTSPTAPLDGQLWWDSGNLLLKVYNGITFKTISAATSSASQPTSNSTGDLWFDTTNQQLKVWTGAAFLLVGPAFTAGTGTTGAIPDTIVDNGGGGHVVIKFYVNNNIVAIMSKDLQFTTQVAISGFANPTVINPGMQLAASIGGVSQLFQGTATTANALISGATTYTPSSFLQKDVAQTTTGTLGILNNSGLVVGTNSDFLASISGANVLVANQTAGGNMVFRVKYANSVITTAMTIFGANGAISGNQINANYADVAERFAADSELLPGTVVELGGTHEITRVNAELSNKVFGVISTRAAYLMNSQAGNDLTHPAVAITGRVPVQVIGVVNKGDRLVSAGNGVARAAQAGEADAFNVIGRSLEAKITAELGQIEAIVTIK